MWDRAARELCRIVSRQDGSAAPSSTTGEGLEAWRMARLARRAQDSLREKGFPATVLRSVRYVLRWTRRARSGTARKEGVRWWWDHPLPDSRIRGPILVVEGWLTDCPEGAYVVVTSGGTILASSGARVARPDVAAVYSLANDLVGFRFEVDLPPAVVDGHVSLALGIAWLPERRIQVLEERRFLVADPESLS